MAAVARRPDRRHTGSKLDLDQGARGRSGLTGRRHRRGADARGEPMTVDRDKADTGAGAPDVGPFGPAIGYMIDAAQRTILFFDVMRQRGNQYREHQAQVAPHVLSYACELVVDGRTLERPVNYALVRI